MNTINLEKSAELFRKYQHLSSLELMERYDRALSLLVRLDGVLDALADSGYLNENRRKIWVEVTEAIALAALPSHKREGE